MGFGGNQMGVGFGRRIMGSIHARNNPGALRPSHAVRENTRAAMDQAQGEHVGMPYGGPTNTGFVSHARGGELRGMESMRKSTQSAFDTYDNMRNQRASMTGMDPNRPSRRDVKGAYRDWREMEKFSGLGSKSYGMRETTSPDGPPDAKGSSFVDAKALDNTPGPVMKPVLKGARAAGKAVGKAKAKRAAKNTPAASDDPFGGPY